MKLFILQSEKDLIEKELSLEINNINICFIYPEESKFMQALGWREKIIFENIGVYLCSSVVISFFKSF